MTFCKYCGKEIDWTRTKDGKYIPLDPNPVFIIEGEGVDRFYTDEEGVIIGRLAREEEVQTIEQKINTPVGYIPHWKTCYANK